MQPICKVCGQPIERIAGEWKSTWLRKAICPSATDTKAVTCVSQKNAVRDYSVPSKTRSNAKPIPKPQILTEEQQLALDKEQCRINLAIDKDMETRRNLIDPPWMMRRLGALVGFSQSEPTEKREIVYTPPNTEPDILPEYFFEPPRRMFSGRVIRV